MDNHHQLQRTMSLTDLNTSSAIRDAIERDLTVPADKSKHRFFVESPKHDFILPSLTRFDLDFRKFLLSALVDYGIMQELEDANCLNWCEVLPKFLPLQTLGDGNCLMHAASLCMWAIQDRRLLLRKSVYQVLIEDRTDMFRKRWQLEQERHLEEEHGSPVDCGAEQWNEDWKKTIHLASTTKSSESNNLNSLEEIHVFTLANILRRPILILCDNVHRGNYDESIANVNLGGIYLPLLCDSVECTKSPLVIGYHQGHFMSLVTTEDGSITGDDMLAGQRRNKTAVPLEKYDGSTMQLHFLLPEELQNSDRLLREYLTCSKVECSKNGITRTILVANMQSQEPEAHLDKMFKTYFAALQAVYLGKLMEKQLSLPNQTLPMSPVNPHYGSQYHAMETAALCNSSDIQSSTCCSAHKQCKTSGCENYTTHKHEYCYQCRTPKSQLCTSPGCTYIANPDYENLCSVCFTRFRAILDQAPVKPSAPPNNHCNNGNCQNEACAHFHGKCHDCYMKAIHDPNITFGTPFKSKPSTTAKVNQTERNYTFPGKPSIQTLPRQQSRLYCFSQTCNNLLQTSNQIYCKDCLTHLSPESRPDVNVAISSNIDQPVTPKTIYDCCHISGCRLPAVTYHGQLCLKHYHESQDCYQRNNQTVTTHQTAEAKRCITTGCNFFGVPAHNYLCSQCHAKALQDEYDMKKIKAEQDRANAEWIAQMARSTPEQCQYDFTGYYGSRKPFLFEQISAPSRSTSAPPSPNPRRKSPMNMIPCTTKGCPRLGTKDTQGLCEVCFKKEEMLLYHTDSRRNRHSSTP